MNATTTPTDTRAQFHELFGYSDTDIAEYGKYAEQVDRLSIGADDCVMWLPDNVSLPLGIPVAEFTTVENTAYAVADVSDNDDFDRDTVDLLVFECDGKSHAVQLKYVAKAALLAETSVRAVSRNTRIHTDYYHYPPMFPLEHGRLLISPFLGEYELLNE